MPECFDSSLVIFCRTLQMRSSIKYVTWIENQLICELTETWGGPGQPRRPNPTADRRVPLAGRDEAIMLPGLHLQPPRPLTSTTEPATSPVVSPLFRRFTNNRPFKFRYVIYGLLNMYIDKYTRYVEHSRNGEETAEIC